MIKIKTAETIVVSRLISLDLENVEETLAGKIVDLVIELLPYAREYEAALNDLRKDAQGKKPEEVETLVSAKAFEKIANAEVEINTEFTKDELAALAKKKVIKVADLAALYPFVITE